MKLVNVIPATKIPFFENQILTYYSSLDLALGSLVLVDLKNRLLPALVIKKEGVSNKKMTVKNLPYGLKPIKKILKKESLLPKEALKLLLWMQEYYLEPIGLLLQKFLPPSVEKEKKKSSFFSSPAEREIGNLSLHISPTSPLNALLGPKKLFLLHADRSQIIKEAYLFIIKQCFDKKLNSLFLFPDVNSLLQFFEEVNLLYPRAELFKAYYSELKKEEKMRTWEAVSSGSARVVLGTRNAIFLPFEKLNFIVVHQENSPYFKSFDQHPKFCARKVSIELSKIHNAKILLTGQIPSLEALILKKEGLAYDISPANYDRVQKPQIYIVKTHRDSPVLSQSSLSEIAKTLSQGERVIIFSGRIGFSNFIVCKDCGFMFKCAYCDAPLYLNHGKNEPFGRLICRYCNRKQSLPGRCFSCQSANLQKIGFGSQALEKEVSSLFPEVKVGNASDAHVMIATPMIKDKLVEPASLVVITAIDTMLTIPDFRQDEQVFDLISFLVNIAKEKVIIETSNPEKRSIIFAAAQKTQEFLESELTLRKELFYPPFSQIITITFCDKNPIKVSQKALDCLNFLKNEAAKSTNRIEILGPAPCFIPKIRGKFFWQIVLKLDPQAQSFKRALLENKRKEWDVDVDPMNIL